jgi:hypothetical protein
MTTASAAWHEGERRLHEQAGAGARMAALGPRVLRDHLLEQHQSFFALLPYVLLARLDAQGWPEASLLAGPPGFAHSPDPHMLRIEAPLQDLVEGEPVGLLGLQAHTGRRNRLNGWIRHAAAASFDVAVGQSFGNCPKYIHPREALHTGHLQDAAETQERDTLDEAALRMVRAADTFFIATAHPLARTSHDASQGLDMSHRGGPPGFVRVQGDTLVIPDYVGNTFFNTFGNLQLEPRCSLLFIDFATGERLLLHATAEVRQDENGRFLHARICRLLRTRGALPVRWVEAAP